MKPQQLSRKKLRWFRVIAISIPVLILLFAEVLLRLFNYGHDTSLFIKYPDDPNYWVINKYASEKYFTDTTNATKGSIEPFKVEKAKNTFRIFVLGESTTAGYPYLHNGSFHRWLQYRLMHTYPDVNFEVINVSLTAVNSYTVLDFGKQVVNYQPDAVLVYTGHNEYYGALGIGSTSHIANNRFLVQTVLALKQARLVQLVNNVISGLKPASSSPDQRENLMKRMAQQQVIPYKSEAYNAGITQFRNNMTELCRYMQDKKVPVFLSTLVSNEKDLKPFISDLSDTSANLQYAQANDSYQSGKYLEAKQEYIKAKERDLLRFRAPEALNQITTDLAKQYSNVHLVNARTVFEQHSPNGILGNETLLEHVHPNLYGYALLSEAFYQSIKSTRLIKAHAGREMSLAELLSRMPVTKVDSLYGAYTIMMLETGWPFNKPIPTGFKRGDDITAQLAGALSVSRISWLDAMDQLFKYSMAGDKKTALKAVEAVMLEKPQNTTYPIYAGRLSFELGDNADAAFYFKKAYELDPSFANTQNMYLVFLKSDEPAKATPYIDSAIQQHPSDIELVNLKTIVAEIIRLKTTAGKKANMQIAADYHAIGADEAAIKYKQQ